MNQATRVAGTRVRKGLAVRWISILALMLVCLQARAQACYPTSVTAPSPFMGNHGEVFRTADGAVYEVQGSYEYLYAYYPGVTICPDRGKLMIEGKVLGIRQVQPAVRRAGPSTKGSAGSDKPTRPRNGEAPITIVLRVRSCDYFVADGPKGYYLLEWYGGYDPDRGDGIFGDVGGYGFKDVLYGGGQQGRVYVDDFLLSKDSVLEKLREKCE